MVAIKNHHAADWDLRVTSGWLVLVFTAAKIAVADRTAAHAKMKTGYQRLSKIPQLNGGGKDCSHKF